VIVKQEQSVEGSAVHGQKTQFTDNQMAQDFKWLRSLEQIQTVLHKPSSGPLLAYDNYKVDWQLLVRKEVCNV